MKTTSFAVSLPFLCKTMTCKPKTFLKQRRENDVVLFEALLCKRTLCQKVINDILWGFYRSKMSPLCVVCPDFWCVRSARTCKYLLTWLDFALLPCREFLPSVWTCRLTCPVRSHPVTVMLSVLVSTKMNH